MMLPDMTRPANKAATSAEPHFRIRNYGSTPKETFDRRGLSLSDTQTPSSPLRRTDGRTDKWTGVAGPLWLPQAANVRVRPTLSVVLGEIVAPSVRPSVRPNISADRRLSRKIEGDSPAGRRPACPPARLPLPSLLPQFRAIASLYTEAPLFIVPAGDSDSGAVVFCPREITPQIVAVVREEREGVDRSGLVESHVFISGQRSALR